MVIVCRSGHASVHADLNALAASVVGDATGETPELETPDDGKDPAAVALAARMA